MLFLFSAFAADPGPTFHGTWTREGNETVVISPAGEVRLIRTKEGDTLSQGALEGEGQMRSAAMDGCGGEFVFPNDGRLMIELDGPECPVDFSGTYQPVATSVCLPGQEVVFDCPAKGERRISVCRSQNGALNYRYGKVGARELELTKGAHAERALARGQEVTWTFTKDVYSYQVFVVEAGPQDSGRGVLVEKSGKPVTTVSCTD